MQETKDGAYCAGQSVCDALRFVGDASYAVLPRDLAHQLAELKKNLLGGLRWAIEKNIEWIDARVAGGDRLREEWQSTGATHTTGKETAGSGI